MKFRLASILTFTSLAGCVLILAAGMRSYRVGDILIVSQNAFGARALQSRELGVTTGRGRYLFSFSNIQSSLSDPRDDAHFHAEYPPGTHWKRTVQLPQDLHDIGWNQTFWRRRGFAAIHHVSNLGAGASRTSLAAPFWFLTIPFSFLPALSIVRRLGRRRCRNRGMCPACGYDLRATPGRCPECAWSPTGRSRSHILGTTVRASGWAVVLITGTAIALSGPPARLLPSQADLLPSTRPGYKPDTRPTTGITIVPSKAIPDFKGLPSYHADHPIPEAVRELAINIDTSRTYFFLDMHNGINPRDPKRRWIAIRLYARPAHRWRIIIQDYRPGDIVGNRDFPTGLKLGEIRTTKDDVLVTFIRPDGSIETRSGNADLRDPVQKFLGGMVGVMGGEWERVLFPS